MFAKKTLSLALLASVLLTGCFGTTEYVKVPVYVPVDIETTFLETVSEPLPPDEEYFLYESGDKLEDAKRQTAMLFMYAVELIETIQTANSKISKTNDVYTKHLKRIDEMNKSTEK